MLFTVVVISFAGLDVVGLLHSASRQDLIRTTIQILEKLLRMAKENGSSGINVICDMEGFSLRQYAWRPGLSLNNSSTYNKHDLTLAAEYIFAIIQMYEANYPEILKACYIINGR